jgi:hypothetical protein
MTSGTRLTAASILYGVLVFAGSALFGFVIAPLLAIASGRFPIDTEARAVVSWLTLRGVPSLLMLAALSATLYPKLSQRGLRVRLALYTANVLLAWLVAASIALAILG